MLLVAVVALGSCSDDKGKGDVEGTEGTFNSNGTSSVDITVVGPGGSRATLKKETMVSRLDSGDLFQGTGYLALSDTESYYSDAPQSEDVHRQIEIGFASTETKLNVAFGTYSPTNINDKKYTPTRLALDAKLPDEAADREQAYLYHRVGKATGTTSRPAAGDSSWRFLGAELVEQDGTVAFSVPTSGVYAVTSARDSATQAIKSSKAALEGDEQEYDIFVRGMVKERIEIVKLVDPRTAQILAVWRFSCDPAVADGEEWKTSGPSHQQFKAQLEGDPESSMEEEAQGVRIRSTFVNRPIVKVTYCGSTSADADPLEPLGPYPVLPDGTNGEAIENPEDDCSLKFAGYVQLTISEACGDLTTFNRDVMQPLEAAFPGRVWATWFRIVGEGFVAEVMIDTDACTKNVLDPIRYRANSGTTVEVSGRGVLITASAECEPIDPIPGDGGAADGAAADAGVDQGADLMLPDVGTPDKSPPVCINEVEPNSGCLPATPMGTANCGNGSLASGADLDHFSADLAAGTYEFILLNGNPDFWVAPGGGQSAVMGPNSPLTFTVLPPGDTVCFGFYATAGQVGSYQFVYYPK